MNTRVEIYWTRIGGDDDELWDSSGVVYAYLDGDARQVHYIGKADTTTVWERYKADDKQTGFWRDYEARFEDASHTVVVGALRLPDGRRFSSKLLRDIESLLIFGLKPWGNITSIRSRIPRQGLRARCKGDWEGPAVFLDEGDKVIVRDR